MRLPRIPAMNQILYERLIGNAELSLSDHAFRDLAGGRVGAKLLTILATLLSSHSISVRLIKSGHPMGPVSPAGRRNDHYFYGALDIDAVDDLPVDGNGSAAGLVDVGHLLMGLAPERRANLVMGPAEWHQALGGGDTTGFRDDSFANAIHSDHLHIGVDQS
jgi:hypothetical protein